MSVKKEVTKTLLGWIPRAGQKFGIGGKAPATVKSDVPFEQLAFDLGPAYANTARIEDAATAAARAGGWTGAGTKVKNTAKFLAGTPGRAATTAGITYLTAPTIGAIAGLGGGLLEGVRQWPASLVGGETTEVAPVDYTTGIWDPMQAYNEAVTAQQQALLGKMPTEASLTDNLTRFGAMLGGGGSGGGAPAGGNVYSKQARAGLNQAAAGTGTATSGLVPVAGTVAAQADALMAQGASLDDYLAFMNRAADAAGVSRNSAARAQLYNQATAAFIKRQTAIQDKVLELEAAKQANALKMGMIPPFVVDANVQRQAEVLQKQGGNVRPVTDYINMLKQQHYWNYLNQTK